MASTSSNCSNHLGEDEKQHVLNDVLESEFCSDNEEEDDDGCIEFYEEDASTDTEPTSSKSNSGDEQAEQSEEDEEGEDSTHSSDDENELCAIEIDAPEVSEEGITEFAQDQLSQDEIELEIVWDEILGDDENYCDTFDNVETVAVSRSTTESEVSRIIDDDLDSIIRKSDVKDSDEMVGLGIIHSIDKRFCSQFTIILLFLCFVSKVIFK